MSVSVTFEPSGISGLVAQGTYLVDAAKRMGAPVGTGCLAGKSECPACVVSIKTGVELLSAPSAFEEKVLGPEGLSNSLRMVCQTKIEGLGEIVLMASSYKRDPSPNVDLASDIEKKFAELSLNQKIAALFKFEAIAMSEAFDIALQKPLAFGAKAFDSLKARTRATTQADEKSD